MPRLPHLQHLFPSTTASLHCSELGSPVSPGSSCFFSVEVFSKGRRRSHLFCPTLRPASFLFLLQQYNHHSVHSVNSPVPLSAAVSRVWVGNSYNVYSHWCPYQATPVGDCVLPFLFLGLLLTPVPHSSPSSLEL